MLSLAAGTVLDLAPDAVVACAAEAGYPLCGVRLGRPRAEAAGVAAALRATGVGLLDVEVVRLLPGPLSDAHRELAGTAATLGARFLLTVSQNPDEAETIDRVAELAALLAGSRTRIALEPMAFTALRTRADAERVARCVPGTTVLLDPLHLYRAGTPLDVAADPALTGYAQLTDVGSSAPPSDLAHEARHDRMPPGEGVLALAGFVAALPPDVPLSVEVQSDRLAAELDPLARARHVRAAAQRCTTGVAGS
ncbi:sugar phosphate isomerase/epimerase family protein [Pseudonocardia sp. GCM10023141]|uniref:sugar phosphate isomerase/epimerase family protein n=1 Tax=Pseudonocardia sp. GCM10023141 TaxID=3252653 RepID=UPI003614BC68